MWAIVALQSVIIQAKVVRGVLELGSKNPSTAHIAIHLRKCGFG